MARSTLEDPLKDFRWRLDVPGFLRMGFMKQSGLSSSTEVAEYNESGDNETPKKSPTQSKSDDITLERGIIIGDLNAAGGASDFAKWRKDVRDFNKKGTSLNFRKTMTLTEYDNMNQPARKFLIYQCWPSADAATDNFDALGKNNRIEKLTVVNEGYDQVPL